MITQVILFLLFSWPGNSVHTTLDKSIALDKINTVRQEGCRCGGKKMPAVGKVIWSETLYKSASAHAKDMSKNHYFSHFSKKGEDVGKRVDKFDYNWLVVGENIAEGQRDFDQVLKDWLKSPSHCKMIMDGKVNEMGIAHAGKYWVQHFGKQKSE